MTPVEESHRNPFDLLDTGSMPSTWCPGCGLGIAVTLFMFAVEQTGMDREDMLLLCTGIGCTGKVSEILSLPVHQNRNGDLISTAVKRMAGRDTGKLVLFLDDADFIATGSEHFVQAGVSKADILIVFFNSFVYRIFSEHRRLDRETMDGESFRGEASPLNIPRLARLCGASFAARWTPYHPRRFSASVVRGLLSPGLAVVEMISPCYMYYPNIGSFGKIIDKMAIVKEYARLKRTESVDEIALSPESDIIVGEFAFNEA